MTKLIPTFILLALPCFGSGGVEGQIMTLPWVRADIHIEVWDQTHALGETHTDQNGSYQFANLPPGTYRLGIVGTRVQPTITLPFTISNQTLLDQNYVVRPSTAALLAGARAYARWDPQELAGLVSSFPQWFTGQNEIYACAGNVAAQLLAGALAMPSQAQMNASAMEVGRRTGAPAEIVGRVTQDLVRNQAYIVMMGMDMNDLATSIRGLIGGNTGPWMNTQLYRSTVNQPNVINSLLAQAFPQFPGFAAWYKDVIQAVVFELTFPVALTVCN